MSDSERGQVSSSAAEVYDAFFVPALFAEWTDRVAEAAGVGPGQRVLDVACGTGVLARAVRARVGPEGSVVGLDANPGMLAVAQRVAPDIEWRQGRAEALDFPDAAFDAVVSQFGLMFFEDRVAALREMARVLRPGGRMAVAVWAALESSPGYARLAGLLGQLFGPGAAAALRAPFVLGDPDELYALFAQAGLPRARVTTQAGLARFPSLEAWMTTEIRGWTLADAIDDEGFDRLLRAADQDLREFVRPDGSVEFACPAHIVTAEKA